VEGIAKDLEAVQEVGGVRPVFSVGRILVQSQTIHRVVSAINNKKWLILLPFLVKYLNGVK